MVRVAKRLVFVPPITLGCLGGSGDLLVCVGREVVKWGYVYTYSGGVLRAVTARASQYPVQLAETASQECDEHIPKRQLTPTKVHAQHQHTNQWQPRRWGTINKLSYGQATRARPERRRRLADTRMGHTRPQEAARDGARAATAPPSYPRCPPQAQPAAASCQPRPSRFSTASRAAAGARTAPGHLVREPPGHAAGTRDGAHSPTMAQTHERARGARRRRAERRSATFPPRRARRRSRTRTS